MAQPFKAKDQDGISTWSMADLRKHQEQMAADEVRELQARRIEESKAQAAGTRGPDHDSDYDMDEDDEAELMALDQS